MTTISTMEQCFRSGPVLYCGRAEVIAQWTQTPYIRRTVNERKGTCWQSVRDSWLCFSRIALVIVIFVVCYFGLSIIYLVSFPHVLYQPVHKRGNQPVTFG